MQNQLLSLVWQIRMAQVKNQLAIRFVGGIKAGEFIICKPAAIGRCTQHRKRHRSISMPTGMFAGWGTCLAQCLPLIFIHQRNSEINKKPNG